MCVSVCLCDSIQGHSNRSPCCGFFSPGSDFPLQAGVAPLLWEPCPLLVSRTLGAALFSVLRLPGPSECPSIYAYPKAHGLPYSSSCSARFLQRLHLYSRLFCHFLNSFENFSPELFWGLNPPSVVAGRRSAEVKIPFSPEARD